MTVTRTTMTTEQRQNYLKAKIALALYNECGRVPQEAEIEQIYHLTRVLYTTMLGRHYSRHHQKQSEQSGLV